VRRHERATLPVPRRCSLELRSLPLSREAGVSSSVPQPHRTRRHRLMLLVKRRREVSAGGDARCSSNATVTRPSLGRSLRPSKD
jgi:hypothetical protein